MQRLVISILLIVFAGVVFHAPLSVFFSVQWPEYDLLIKSWKEILLGLASGVLAIYIIRTQRYALLRDTLLYVTLAYAALHLLMLPVFWQGLIPSVAGLLIDLRFVLFFVLVYLALKIWPQYRRHFFITGIVSALISLLFAVLQVYVLPIDILTYLGYSRDTIAPYLTVDRNYDFIRINGTLRGPNPLGAYAAIVLSTTLAYAALAWRKLTTKHWALLAILNVFAIIAIWFSFSRSALGAAIIAVGVIMLVSCGRKLPIWTWIAAGLAGFGIIVAILLNWNSTFVQNVILHTNPEGGSATQSNEEHLESLIEGSLLMASQPLGAGVGSTGSASLLGDESGLIIENQYLYIAHEVGWAGLALFLVIFGIILWRLWLRRRDPLALAVLASGLGCAAIGVLLPVWADDTVALIWWGLAAIALSRK